MENQCTQRSEKRRKNVAIRNKENRNRNYGKRNPSNKSQIKKNQIKKSQIKKSQIKKKPIKKSRINKKHATKHQLRKRLIEWRKKRQEDGMVHYYDYSLLAVIIFLVCFGLVMLYSASSYQAQLKYGDSMAFFKKQAMVSALSFIVMLGVSKVNYHRYIKISKPLYIFSFVLMALVLTPLGIESYGARRWIRLPFNQQMQPAEVTKIAVILYMAFLICKEGNNIKNLKPALKMFGWGVLAALGVFKLTDNLSSAIIVLGIAFIMFAIVYPKSRPIVICVAIIGVVGYVGLHLVGDQLEAMNGFRVQRILTWLHPELHEDDGGYQVIQAKYAIGSGGFLGKGLGNSTQKMIIPEVQNDIILSIICEELGVFGAALVFLLFGFLLYRLLFIARNAPDLYGSLIVTGIFIHIAIQVVLNVCVVLQLIPTTGITLPFISYGGTTILFLMIEMGIALGVAQRIRFEE